MASAMTQALTRGRISLQTGSNLMACSLHLGDCLSDFAIFPRFRGDRIGRENQVIAGKHSKAQADYWPLSLPRAPTRKVCSEETNHHYDEDDEMHIEAFDGFYVSLRSQTFFAINVSIGHDARQIGTACPHRYVRHVLRPNTE